MPTSFGKRARTRQKYSKGFRMHGMPAVTRYLVTYNKGDFVDIVCDPSIQKGMPYSFYHGRTGVVFNVTRRAVGVEVKKVVGNRQIVKRLHVRIEHVRKSRCNELFLKRVKENDKAHHDAHLQGKTIKTKRTVKGPRDGAFVDGDNVEVLEPAAFEELY
ncbi:60S ribosomal protein L21-2 [Cyclospora cayetanensis]|uniref:60S ribosomal protein L21-2 n=2 Tax=Cyclospora cayetanensis TaxID=88456 RepID=A0A6P5WDJ9_9EIME|nr:60S ribosomal protein L21-2 [Cyclospora cayetanensis]OEH77419.1 ribosomal protein rpl21 [Cyclospora cayetanensis]